VQVSAKQIVKPSGGAPMDQEKKEVSVEVSKQENDYEAPAIETVMTSDELTREVHYAGAQDSIVFIG
jgi:hypothetical protein